MGTDPQMQSAEPGTPSATSTEEKKVNQENENRETNGEVQPNIADNQKSGAGQPPEGNTEYYDEQKRKFEFWKQELSAEWEPTGIAEHRAVLDLAYLYWQRDRILEEAARAEELEKENRKESEETNGKESPEENGKESEDNGNLTPEEEQEALPDKVLEIGLTLTTQERIERDQAHFDQLIEKKIEWIVFLKASKKRIYDLSDRESTVVSTGQRPRGVYRKSHSKRQQSNPNERNRERLIRLPGLTGCVRVVTWTPSGSQVLGYRFHSSTAD